jgi:ribosomal protein S18 acetylase RimI-like enzyme
MSVDSQSAVSNEISSHALSFTCSEFDAAAIQAYLPQLIQLLTDCVLHGASVGFMADLTEEKAAAFWHKVQAGVAAGERRLWAALDAQHRLAGTVQLITGMPDNQPHRAEIAKLLVFSHQRRKGIARALMLHAQREARNAGKSLLVLDTETGSPAALLYRSLGWQVGGHIPGYARLPSGLLAGTSIFYMVL